MAKQSLHTKSARLPRRRQAETLELIDARQILRLLRERDFESRAEMERASGFAPSRMVAALDLLTRKGLIEPAEQGKSGGRRSSAVRINGSYGHVIGIDIGGSNLRIALADMSGAIVGKWSTSTARTSSPKVVVERIRTGVAYLLEHHKVPKRSLLAVAAGAPGVTDTEQGVVLATSYLKGWRNVPFRTLLEQALHIPAAIENDVRVAAIGENWLGAARGIRNFVFLAIGTGIAAGIVVNGQLVRGTDWTAGEVGYMLVPGVPEISVKRGVPGPLESIIGGEGLKQQSLEVRRAKGVLLQPAMSATEIFEHAQAGEAFAQEILDRSARLLAYSIYNISLVVNCSLCVLGGGVGMSEILRDATRKVLEEYREPVRPKLALSSLGKDAQLIGTIRLALDKAESRIGLRS